MVRSEIKSKMIRSYQQIVISTFNFDDLNIIVLSVDFLRSTNTMGLYLDMNGDNIWLHL